MQSNREGQTIAVWALLLVWLFFGGLALSERIGLLEENTAYDEEALAALQDALKPQLEHAQHIQIALNAAPSVRDLSSVPQFLPGKCLPSSFSLAIARYQLLSTLRI